MKELLVATSNKGKMKEITLLLQETVESILSPLDYPAIPEVEEDGLTFAENALKKARSAALATGKPTVADDSGLIVDALGGLPGVRSARYAGETATDAENNALLLRELQGVPRERRSASFCCVVALCLPDGACHTFQGVLSGSIQNRPRGGSGFGYDPLFLVTGHDKTLAELPLEIKNLISHRGRAFALLKEFLLDAKMP